MKQVASKVVSLAGKIDSRHIQLALLILTLILFVLGAGAPASGGSGVPGNGG